MLWLDGLRLEGTSARFDLRDRGLLLGDGVFDTSLTLNGAMVFANQHVGRLADSCNAFSIPFNRLAAEATLAEAASEIGTGTIRITVTRGPAPRGLLPPSNPTPHIIVAAYPGAPAAMWRPAKLGTTEIRRNETSPTSRHKCLAYLDAVLALKAAAYKDAEEVLFQNTAGHIACCATGNLFVLAGNMLKTPPLADGVLAGVLRQTVLELATAAKLTPVEVSLTKTDLAAADAVFMTSSLRLIAPIVTLDAIPLATKGLGKALKLAHILTEHIQQTYGLCSGIEEGLAAWPISI